MSVYVLPDRHVDFGAIVPIIPNRKLIPIFWFRLVVCPKSAVFRSRRRISVPVDSGADICC